MPRYRLHRIKEMPKEHFRWSAHTGGVAVAKPRDYEPGGEVESQTPYSLWKELRDSASPHNEPPLSPGDILEAVDTEGAGPLLIAKYIGFEPAHWFVAEPRAAASTVVEEDLSNREQHAESLSQ